VTNLARAVGFLGFDTVHQLVLSASIFSALEHVQCDSFNIADFWKHSVGTGMASETIARMVKHKSPADLFTAGLIHDIGKVAYIAVAPKTFNQIVQECTERRISFSDAEAMLKVPTHTDVGPALAKRWLLPENLQYTVLFHHQKDPALRPNLKPNVQKEIDIVMLANLFVHGLNFGNSGHSQISSAPKHAFERLGLNSKSLPQISKEISKSLQSCDAFLKVLSSAPAKKTAAA
jgi:HD-like signal output (HDOD) protein